MRRLLPLLALALAACGADPDTTSRAGEGTAVAVDHGNLAWPANAPAHAPPYPGARVTSVIRSVSNGVAGSRLSFETDDTPTAVVTFYRDRAGKAGLPEVATLTNDATALYSAGAPNGARLNVEATAGAGKTVVGLTFSKAGVGR